MKLYDFEAIFIRETEQAILLEVEDKEVWFPKSIIEDHRNGTYTVPESWAVEKEII